MEKTSKLTSIILKVSTTLMIVYVAFYLRTSQNNMQANATLQRQTAVINETVAKLKDLKDPKVNAIIGIK